MDRNIKVFTLTLCDRGIEGFGVCLECDSTDMPLVANDDLTLKQVVSYVGEAIIEEYASDAFHALPTVYENEKAKFRAWDLFLKQMIGDSK